MSRTLKEDSLCTSMPKGVLLLPSGDQIQVWDAMKHIVLPGSDFRENHNALLLAVSLSLHLVSLQVCKMERDTHSKTTHDLRTISSPSLSDVFLCSSHAHHLSLSFSASKSTLIASRVTLTHKETAVNETASKTSCM